MSLEIKIVQTAVEKKPMPLKVILGADFLYGSYDEGWRLHSGVKGEENLICYMPTQLARGIAVTWSEDELDMITLRALIPTATVELRAFHEMIYRICTYWQCDVFVNDELRDLDEFLDEYPSIIAFNQQSLNNMAKSIMSGENEEATIFAVTWPLVMGRSEAEAFIAEPSYFSKWLHDKQKIDAYFASPTFYRTEKGVIGRYAVGEDTRCIMPIKPYVPYGYDDPETGTLVQCDDYAVIIFDINTIEQIGEIKHQDFIASIRKNFSSKVRRYDGNHIIFEALTMDELKSLL